MTVSQRSHPTYRICVVCSGNICRSPMGEVVLRHAFEEAGLAHLVAVDSAGTGDWHVGYPADFRAVQALADDGLDGSAHLAKQFEPGWVTGRELVLVADRGHLRAVRALAQGITPTVGTDHVRLLRDFDPEAAGADLADPYYGDAPAFAEVLRQVRAAAPGIVDYVSAELGRSRAAG